MSHRGRGLHLPTIVAPLAGGRGLKCVIVE